MIYTTVTGRRFDLEQLGSEERQSLAKVDAIFVSNNHVLANENGLPVGSAIFQPGLLDGGDVDRDLIAALTRFVAIDRDSPNAVDCAIAEILDRDSVRPTFLAAEAPGTPVAYVTSGAFRAH